jgi:hypothetical protein
MTWMAAVSSVALLFALSLGVSSAAPQREAWVRRSALVLTGSTQGLYPGGRVPLRVTIRNRRRFPVRVQWLGARVVLHRRACAPSNVTVERRRLDLFVPARGLRVVTLEAHMRNDAPDGCKGVLFRLWYEARGRRP